MSSTLDLTRLSLFVRGSILHFHLPAANKDKFAVVMGTDRKQDLVLLVVTTSQTGFFQRNPDKPHVVIQAKTISVFGELTILNCHEPHRMQRSALEDLYDKGELKPCGPLPDDVLREVHNVLANSYYLSAVDKAIMGVAEVVDE